MDIIKYLEENNVDKQISRLVKKCKNKRVVFYGAGEFFYKIKANYDLSGFNVVGICDQKFSVDKNENKSEYPALTRDELKTYDYDVIIITLLHDLQLLPSIEYGILKGSKNQNADIYPIMTPTIKYLFKQLFKK